MRSLCVCLASPSAHGDAAFREEQAVGVTGLAGVDALVDALDVGVAHVVFPFDSVSPAARNSL